MNDHKAIDIQKLQKGDKKEFEHLFHSFYSYLCLYAETIVGDSCAAEDLVSDFFLSLWENITRTDIHTSLRAYLVRSVHNNCLKYLEHRKVVQKRREQIQYMLDNRDLFLFQSDEHPLSQLISKESLALIEKAIDSLPSQCRDVFVAIRMEELSYEETAQKLGISINTVRTQITRAMKKLKDAIRL
jgi:RNA polymerase sigma-70 factor (ECF subfamily)